jgi:hypothetical protein
MTAEQLEVARDKRQLEGLSLSQARWAVYTQEQKDAFQVMVEASQFRRQLKDAPGEIIKRAEISARHREVEFTITAADLTWPTHCPVLGVELDYGPARTSKAYRDNAPSLDRVDFQKGYVPGNVVVVSWRANTLRKNGTVVEFEALVRYWMFNEAPPSIRTDPDAHQFSLEV